MVKLFKWQEGRQGTGYEIFPMIYSRMMGIDLYLIRYGVGAMIPEHTDKCESGRMFRLNAVIRKASKGGIFKGKTLWSISDRVHWFRPDESLHEVTEVLSGTRYVLSFGIVRI